jgi:hypothetical protein
VRRYSVISQGQGFALRQGPIGTGRCEGVGLQIPDLQVFEDSFDHIDIVGLLVALFSKGTGIQAIIWIVFCVLMPLVGVNYASRMVFLSFLPARLSYHERPEAGTRIPLDNVGQRGCSNQSH